MDIQDDNAFVTDQTDELAPKDTVGDGSIQRGVDIVAVGGTVNVSAGTFEESVHVGKQVTIDGQGPANTVVDAGGGSNDGFSVEADAVVIRDLRVTNADDAINFDNGVVTDGVSLTNIQADSSGAGIHVRGTATNLTLGDVVSTLNTTGFRVATAGNASGLTIENSDFSHNQWGVTVYAWNSLADNEDKFDGVTIQDSSFSNNSVKGLYFEKLNNATLNNVTVDQSGTGDASGAGIDINLKYGTYTNIDIIGSSITNSGTGGPINGAGLTIKARGTGNDPSYASNPATLTDVLIDGTTIDGNQHGVRIGEPGKDNTGPTSVVLNDVDITESVGVGLEVVGGEVTLVDSDVTSSTTNDAGVRVTGSGSVVVSNSTVTGSTIGIDVVGAVAMVEGTDLTGNTTGVLIQNSGVADLGDAALDRDITGLGSSAGGNDFTGYTSSSATSGAIVNLNTGGLDSNSGPQGAPPDVAALGNTFDPSLVTPVMLEDVIYHDGDHSHLGFVQVSGGTEFSIDDVTMSEGDGSGTASFTFTITRSDNLNTVSVDYSTLGITATAGTDFTTDSGTVNFAAGGALTKTVTIEVAKDDIVELTETFAVNLSNAVGGTILDDQGIGTITNDDSAELSIDSDITLAEGNSRYTVFTFTATLSSAVDAPVLALWNVSEGTATFSDGDMATTSGYLGFNPGETTKTFNVLVAGDTAIESDEDFEVALNFVMPNGRDVMISATGGQATGAIENDDSNQAPIAVDDYAVSTTEDTAVVFDAVGNDSDPDGTIDRTSVAIGTGPTNGSLAVDSVTGVMTYTPDADFFGTDTFTYPVNDNKGDPSNLATVFITVIGVNDAPVAKDFVSPNAAIPEDSIVTGLNFGTMPTELVEDVDDLPSVFEADHFTILGVSIDGGPSITAADAGITVDGNGDITIDTTVAAYQGLAAGQTVDVVVTQEVADAAGLTDIGTLTFQVVGVNDSPEAVDAVFGVAENAVNGAAVDTYFAQATDIDGDVLSFALSDGDADPGNDVFAIDATTGEITVANASLLDHETTPTYDLTVTVTDNPTGASTTATVRINVNDINEAPVAMDDLVSGVNTAMQVFDVVGNDFDPDDDTLKVTHVNGDAVSVGDSIAIVGVGTLQFISGGVFSFMAEPGYTTDAMAPDTFTYTVADPSGAASVLDGTVTLNIVAGSSNAPPEADTDSYTIDEDTVLVADGLAGRPDGVLANDTDPENQALTSVLLTNPANGSASLLANGALTYTPDENFVGVDTFTYRVLDGFGGSDSGTISVTVENVNDPPVVTGATTFAIDENSVEDAVVGQIVANDGDGTSQALAYALQGADAVPFKVDGVGNIQVAAGADLNFELKDTYEFEVVITDDGTTDNVTIVPVTVTLNDLSEAGPTVTSVRVSSTAWSSAFKDRVEDDIFGNGGEGYVIPTDSNQMKPLPWINMNQIIVEFSEDVSGSIGIGDFSLSGIAGLRPDLTTGNIPQVLSVDAAGNKVTLTLNQVLDASQMTLKVLSQGVTNATGDRLDGGDFVFQFNVLPGDVNQDGEVTTVDSGLVSLTALAAPHPNHNRFHNVDGDNIENSTDQKRTIEREGSRLVLYCIVFDCSFFSTFREFK
ncbi:MAG: beta strand repeat-containing protein [Rhodopirellula sp. JB055]|uniref:beta strand repeat-containing protein n=1 Tax=Rhodopirellula sp. JB055 TaxID=3342846 RepID=UPI00370BECE7